MSEDEDEKYSYESDDNQQYGSDYDGSDDDGKHSDYYYEKKPTYAEAQQMGSGIVSCWLKGIDGLPLKTQNPLGRFCLAVDAISRKINETRCGVNFNTSQIQILLNKSQELPRVGYKNPTAFILGYISTSGGKRGINKETLEVAWKCYNAYTDTKKIKSLQKPDIIRYARLWYKK